VFESFARYQAGHRASHFTHAPAVTSTNPALIREGCSVLSHLFGRIVASRNNRGTQRNRRPRLERLEARDLPAPLTWNAGITLPEARGGLAAAMQNGAVAVFDGSNADVPALTVSNPTWQGSYSMDAFLPAAVDGPGVGVLPDGTALVFGGRLNGTATNTGTLYDYTGDGTIAAPNMSTARAFFGFATDQNNNVYAIGGVNQSGSRRSSVEFFNQDANSWTLVTSLPQALSDEPAASDGAGHIFTFGGVDANGAITNDVYEYTIATKQWSQVASMPFAASDSAAVLGSNGRIYVLGGITASGTTASVESYNPSSNTWTTEASLPNPVSSEAAISDPLGRIEVIGGFDSNSNPVANVWISQQLNVPDTAPVFTTSPVTQLYSWGQYSYQVLTSGNPQPTYSLSTAPAGMTIDPITGLINWFPTGNQVGNQNVTIQASNYAGSTTQSFTISLVAPTLPATTPPQATALTAYSFTVPSTGNPTPTFSLVSGPAGMYMSQPSDGTVNWTPTLAQGGPQTFTVQASNYLGQFQQTYTVDVVSTIPLNVTAAGASTTSVTVSWLPVDDPSGATYDVYRRIGHIHGGYSDVLVASGVTGTSATIGGLTESGPGSAGYSFVVRATDNSTGVQSPDSLPATSRTLFPPDLFGVAVNGAVVGTVQAQQGSTVQAQILWYANEAPKFSLVSGPSTMSVDPVTGIVSYTPGPSDLGTITATVQGTNSVGSATEVITYNVVANPNAPVLTLPANQTVAATSAAGATDAAAFTATATDPGGLTTTITYAVGKNPISSGYTFPIGTTTVTVTATDSAGNSSTGIFTVLVQDTTPPTLTLPPNQQVESSNPAGSTDSVAFTATATDPVDPNPVIAYSVGNTVIDSTYIFPQGTTTVTVTASDTAGNSSAGTFTVFVGDVPPTVSFSGLPTGDTVTEGTAINLTATGSAFTPAENSLGLTFTWTVTKVHNGVTATNFASGSGTGSSVPISFVADDDGTYTVSVTATDVNGASTRISQAITSTTVAPTTAVSGPSDGVTYQPRQFTLTATSPSPLDQASPFSFAINWGDSTTQTVSADSGTPVNHAYAATGSYTVTVSATDKDGVVGTTVSQGITIKTIENQSDSGSQGGATGLAIGGTAGNDTFAISTGSTSGTVSVKLNGVGIGTFTPTGGTIAVFGGTGTNGITFNAPSGAGNFSLNGQSLTYGNSGTGVPLFNLTLVAAPDVQHLIVQGGNTASTYTVQDAAIATTLTAGSGNDTFTFADSGAATQPITVNGGGGTNSLAGADLTNVWILTAWASGTLQAGGEPTDTFSSIQNLTGGAAADTFRMATSSAGVAGSIDGKGGANTLDLSGRTTAVTVTLQTTGLNKATGIGGTFANVQTLIAGTAGTNSLVGPNTATAWAINGTNAGSAAGLSFSGFGNLTGGSGADSFDFSGAGTITGNLNGGAGVNTLDLSAAAGSVTVNLQTRKATPVGGTWLGVSGFVGDNATSTLVGANTTNTWTVTAANAGKVGSITFTGFANLTGGSGNDTFKLANGVGVSGTIDGGGGTNTLDDSAYQTGVVINLQLGTATNVGVIANIQNAKSGTGNSILVGNAAANVLTAVGGNNLIVGGAGSDTVTGGSGSDILIAGTTSYDQNPTALAAILNLWANTSNSYAARVAAVMSSTFQYHLDATTVFDDAAPDKLTGGPGLSLFFAHIGGTTGDTTNARTGETVVQI
jgi:hypothetical protein